MINLIRLNLKRLDEPWTVNYFAYSDIILHFRYFQLLVENWRTNEITLLLVVSNSDFKLLKELRVQSRVPTPLFLFKKRHLVN